jgi:CHASE3 domain sensor protein
MRLLVLSIYNVAIEQEYLGNYNKAKQEANKGLSYIRTFLLENKSTQAVAKKFVFLSTFIASTSVLICID